MSDPQDRDQEEEDGAERFFSVKQSERKDSAGSRSLARSGDSDEDGEQKGCLTLRILQYILPCLRNKNVWEQSQGDVFKSHDAEEAKYPRTLRILESRVFDVIFVTSCILSIYLFLFSEGFLLESRLLWGIIHLVNAVYALGLFSQWLQILIKSKYAKTNHGYTTRDILYTLASVFPADLIVLVIYTLNDEDDNEDNETSNPIEHWMITLSRLNYFLRIRSIWQYFSKWEHHLVVGDFSMFILRTLLSISFLLHLFACIWHRIACKSFRLKHFLMTSDEATTAVCSEETWIYTLKTDHAESPLLYHPGWHILFSHYFVSVYWTIMAGFRLGGGDIETTLTKLSEVAFVTFIEITGWIFVLVNISGTLASLVIEKSSEKERFLNRLFAIRHFLRFSNVARGVQDEVNRFYTYLWEKSKGIVNVDLIEVMHPAMKSEVYYDVNKFVMDQMPMLKGLDTPFLMSLSVHTTHKFFLSGAVLFRKNETAEAMYYLVKGRLDILNENEQHVIATIRSGSIIGEVHLLQPYPHIATVRCGTNCDILVLTRKHFRQVVGTYPQFKTVLEQRLETRLEQSGLLLALCDKHNTYHKPFKALQEITTGANRLSNDSDPGDRYSFENVARVVGNGATVAPENPKHLSSTDEDFDGIQLSEDIAQKVRLGTAGSGGSGASSVGTGLPVFRQDQQKYFDQILAEACLALETDVARAGSLSTDLNIPRPPLIVAAPENNASLALLGFYHHQDAGEGKGNIFSRCFKQLSDSSKAGRGIGTFLWDLLVCFCALSAFWYYPYQFAFRDEQYYATEYIFHLTDVVFCLDCIHDMMQVVVTPKKTLESFSEILTYRLKTVYFYIRVISFIPLEYIFATPIGIGRSSPSLYFYVFKFNRLLQIHLVFPFLSNSKGYLDFISPVLMALVQLVLGIFFVSHIASVAYKFVLRDVSGKDSDPYGRTYYRALAVTTSTGYGDIRSTTNWEVLVEVLGLILGISTIIYLQAKVTMMLVNRERRRTNFHKLFYSIKDFMGRREFPKSLGSRVSQYYNLQWEAHQGTFYPWERQWLSDAPKSLKLKVGYSLGHKYVNRIPLFMHCPVYLQTEFCLAFSQHVIPPGEVLLYPDELIRELYVVCKGCVEVIHKQKIIGTFGEGRYFGLSGLLYGANTNFMFRTRTHCHVYCLSYESFIKVANSNANFLQEYNSLVKGHEEAQAAAAAAHHSKSRTSSKSSKSKGLNSKMDISVSSHGTIFSEFSKLQYPSQHFLDSLVESSPPLEYDYQLDQRSPTDTTGASTTSPPTSSKKNKPPNSFLQFLSSCSQVKFSDFHFRPHGTPLKIWATFRVLCAILATLLAPFQLAFPIHPWTSFKATLALDIVAWLDILVGMRCAFLGDKNQMITDSRKMAARYFKGNFVLDFLSSFPADMIFFFLLMNQPQFGHRYHLISFLRLNRMLQICHLIMAKNMLEKSMFKSLSFIMLLEMVPLLLIYMNLTTCIATLWACHYSETGDVAKCAHQDSWILNGLRHSEHVEKRENLHDIFSSYVVGMYWVTISAFCVGFGGVDSGQTLTNQLIAICIILSGLVTVTYVGSKLTSCICAERREKIVLQEKMKLMDGYLEQHRVSKNCRLRVFEVYLNAWNKSNGVSPAALFPNLPPTLFGDVMKQLYGPLLKTSPLFKELDEPGLRLLARSITEMFYPEGEFLMKFGDLCDDVFFITNGAVVCYNVRGDIMCQLGGGSLIGETAQYFNAHRLYSAIAVMDVTVFVFKKTVFLEFLGQYPKIKAVVDSCSLKHYKEAMGSRKIAGSMDSDVLLTYHNEKNTPEHFLRISNAGDKQQQEEDTFFKSPFLGAKQPNRKSVSPSLADLRRSASVRGGASGDDSTRNALSEDVMKNTDESVKSTAERWTGVLLTYGRKSRDEMGLVHIYQEFHKCTLLNFCIHPASPVVGWSCLFLVLTTVSCAITSYEIAFASRHRITETTFLVVMRYMLEVFFIVRILGNFHLGYYDVANTLVTNAKQIAKRYVRKVDGLWLDIVTTFPFHFFEHVVPVKGEYLRSLQLLRVFLFVRYLRETDNTLRLKASRVKIIKITVLLCFIFHFWACAWYLIACTDECATGSWMQEVMNKFQNRRTAGDLNDEHVPTATRYLLSLYYVTNALTYTGFDDITARTNIELCLTIAMIIGTLFVIGYLVGEMVQTLASQVATKINYEAKLSVLETHFETLGISYQKIHEVRQFFRLLWCRCRGMRFFNLMEELPYTLRADLALEIYGPNLKSSRILGKLDENLIRQIAAKIRHEIYFPGSHIVRAGDVCTSMYFIKKGEVVILDGNSNLELCVEILYENECFGEVKILLPKEQYRFSYVARLESEVGVLHKEDLDAVLKNHPRIFDELKDKANRVKVRRQSLKEEDGGEKGPHGAASSMSIKSTVSLSSEKAK